MKPTEELRQDMRKLAETSPEVASIVEQVDDRRCTWERAALHLVLSIFADPVPQKQRKKTADKG